jgi:hypothetical protein
MTDDEVFVRETLTPSRAQGCEVDVYYPVVVSTLHEAAVLGCSRIRVPVLRPNTIVEQSRKADAAIGSLEIAHLSSWTASAVGAAVALAAAASFAVDSLSAIKVYALAAGPSLILVLFWKVPGFIPPSSAHVSVFTDATPSPAGRQARVRSPGDRARHREYPCIVTVVEWARGKLRSP